MNDQVGDRPTMLAAVLSAYAGREISRHRLLWTLDARLARVVATTTEPMIGQLRLAWWQEALSDAAGVMGRGDPLVDALRAAGEAPPAGLTAWLDGWEAIIADADLENYATGRGGGLFHSLAGEAKVPAWLQQAGAVWALWDFTGHVKDSELGTQALDIARDMLLIGDRVWPAAWRPMRIAYELARTDIVRGKAAPNRLTPRLYFRLLRTALGVR
ncbi:hypothetical protein FIM10_03740 [Sphingomonadales bacterium 56]|nr:hypothetical protein [Sphingomonadales bacterium 56]MBY2957887.1 hypothetical protein [Sphingomonadales bacterium 58]CAD7335934.1 hypothetical protein SPHS6_00757 [Sphingobium sp. S6]CAD7335997.1 hypothetical protein SPHS8_00797 [Sphingobium sp. S8]